MKTYLVEAWDPEVEFDSHSTIVALTPEVCYQLDKAGIAYSIIEDYYDEAGLTALEDEYHESQLRWIESLDEFLRSNIKELPELNLRPATIYYYYLKTMVLDPLYIRYYTLNKLFKTTKPSNVVFISHPPKESPLDFRLRGDGESLYSQVIPILCRENSIQLTPLFLERYNKHLRELEFAEVNAVTRLRRTLGKSGIIRKIYSIYKSFGQQPRLVKQPTNGKLKILMLKLGYGGAELLKDALGNGHDIYQLSDGFILRYSSRGVKRYLNLKAEYEGKKVGLNNIWESTANLLEGDDLIKWINERCQANVSEIVLPRLRYFIARLCPEILGYFKVFTEFYEDEKIDFVLTPHEFSLIEFAAIAAASYCGRTKSVLIYHGADMFANKMWDITELAHFNIHIAPEKELEEYLRYRCEVNNIPTELYNGSSHRLLNIKRIGHLREKQKDGIKERIIYLPIMLMGDTRRFDGANYPDVWYYKFQKSLIEYFATKSEYTFVWKGLPVSDAIYNPIPNFIRDNNFSNIEIATNPFVQHLPSADRVICDYPSTGLYESIVAGVPTMCLYHKALKVRKSAVDHFGSLLKLFSDITEAIKHIDEFLDSDPELYKTTIDVGNESILHILGKVGDNTEQ